MAKESSFDIVSQIALQEIDNAVNQARQEAGTRYDLKHADCQITYEKQGNDVAISAGDEFSLKSLADIVMTKLVRRGIDVKALRLGKVEAISGGRVRQTGALVQGISAEIGREINKLLKQSKLKINVQIQGDQLRVTGKNKDDLQEAIKQVKEKDFGIPIQFINFR